MTAPTKGKVRAVEVLLTKVFNDQMRDIGWLPFLQGKLSKYRTNAYKLTLPKTSATSDLSKQRGKNFNPGPLVHRENPLGTME